MGINGKHQCPSCGGNLIIDNEKQMYCCTSCGSSYDFDYFREEQLHNLGNTSLERGEFNAAIDAFRLILDNAPHDFAALRGLMLASARLRSTDEIISKDRPGKFSYDPDMVKEAVESASEEDKEYFKEFAEIYFNKMKLVDLTKEIRSLKEDKDRLEAKIRLTDDSRYEYYFITRNGVRRSPKAMFIMLWCLDAFFLVSGLAPVIGMDEKHGVIYLLAIFYGVLLLVVTIVNLAHVYPRVKAIKEIDELIIELNDELGRMAQKITSLENDSEKLSRFIKRSSQSFVEKDGLMKTDSVSEPIKETGSVKKHQCPSCGGSLIIDKDKQKYHCTFCGSSYDYEYFKEDQMHEAGETYISRSEFMAAVDAYRFTLSKDPHDFLALRGMMLAAANLSNMSDLEKDPEATEFIYDAQKVKEVIGNASESDKKYFTEFGRVYSERKRLADCNKEIESLREEKEKINSIIAKNKIESENYYEKTKYGLKLPPHNSFIIISVLTVIWTLVIAFFLYGLVTSPDNRQIYGPLFVIHGSIWIILVINEFVVFLPKMLKIKKIEQANAGLYVESGMLDDRIRDLEKSKAKVMSEIRSTIHDFVKKDREVMGNFSR